MSGKDCAETAPIETQRCRRRFTRTLGGNNRRQRQRPDIKFRCPEQPDQRIRTDDRRFRSNIFAGGAGVAIFYLLAVTTGATQDTPVNIISDQISRQGFPCDQPREAEHDKQASKPNGAVWILRCKNATYRVTLVPDMAAHVELIK